MDHRFKSSKPRDRRKPHWGADQTRALREVIAKRDGPNCWLCDKPFGARELPTLDHIVPKSLGGANALYNLKLAHYSCNTARGSRTDPNRLLRGVNPKAIRHSASDGVS